MHNVIRRIALAGMLLFSIHTHASTAVQEMAAAAGELLTSFSTAQHKAAVYPLKSNARATWSNLPTVMAPPAGIMLSELATNQLQLVHRLMRASLSSQGYAKAFNIMWLDDILRAQEQAAIAAGQAQDEAAVPSALRVTMMNNRSSGYYAFAIFGDPDHHQWGWKMTGHHLALNVTVSGNDVNIMPGFYGSNPRQIQQGPYAGFTILHAEMNLGLQLLASLNEEQRKTAVVAGEKPADVIEGPGRRGSLDVYEGLQAKHMDRAQLARLQLLVGEYLRNAAPHAAAAQLDLVAAAGWDNLWFSWRGATDASGEFYYRVHGPRLLIEYNLQNPNHDHMVVRDPDNDYGEDWLGHHYQETHPSYDEYMTNFRRAAGVD